MSKIICWYIEKGFWWIRIFGRGISYKNIKRFDLSFSQRNGYTKFLLLGNHCFTWLPKIEFNSKQIGNGMSEFRLKIDIDYALSFWLKYTDRGFYNRMIRDNIFRNNDKIEVYDDLMSSDTIIRCENKPNDNAFLGIKFCPK